MIISATADQDRYEHAVLARDAAARELFETELALHDAHQTHIDCWITAASDPTSTLPSCAMRIQ
jgi:hypothetical protein